MRLMQTLLVYADSEAGLMPQDPSQESPWDAVKAACCSNATLIALKEEEDSQPHAATFLSAVWALLVKITPKAG